MQEAREEYERIISSAGNNTALLTKICTIQREYILQLMEHCATDQGLRLHKIQAPLPALSSAEKLKQAQKGDSGTVDKSNAMPRICFSIAAFHDFEHVPRLVEAIHQLNIPSLYTLNALRPSRF